MNSWEDAVNRFINAVNEWDKRQAAHDIGTAIGGAIGYPLIRTSAQIDEMTVPEMESWVAAIRDCPPSGVEG